MYINKRKVTIGLIKNLLPGKYYDDIFINKLLLRQNLKILNLNQMLWCSIHGFLPHEYKLYDLENNDYKSYVPSRNNFQKRQLNGSYNAILANKIIFEKHIKIVISGIDKLHVVESIGYIEDGVLKSLNSKVVNSDFTSLVPFLEKNDLVMKQVSGDGGAGLLLIRKEDDHFIFENKKVTWNELVEKIRNLNDYLIQERFKQKGFSNDIYTDSVNTIRVATMIDPVTHKPFIAYAFHRFGLPKSGIADNVSQGGLFSLIGVDDGRMSMLVDYTISGEKTHFEFHPATSKKVYNELVPNWNTLTNRVLEMAGRMPYLKYVGWDVVLSDDEYYILEGNVSPGIGFQMLKPMKDFPEAWSFFKHYKYV